MDYPKYVDINGKKIKINTDFRIAIKCNEIAEDENINDYERSLAIIYLLFGDEGINQNEYYDVLLEKARIYLCCGKEIENNNEKPDMDFVEDMDYIEASFMSDFKIDLENTKMHWWKFMKLMNGLSNSEFGNCCVLNNIRNLRNYDVSTIKDAKEKSKIIEAQKKVALKKKKTKLTQQQIDSIEKFNKLAGINRKE